MISLSKKDFTTLCLCSFRYALERKTAIGFEIANLLLHNKSHLEVYAKKQIKRDIERKIKLDDFAWESDLANWRKVMENIGDD